MKKTLFIICLAFSILSNAQNNYRYTINLSNVKDDRLTIELATPKVEAASVEFVFPKIIPGTYSISDYGKFINNVKAFDKAGKVLPVTKLTENKWKITNATALARITYEAEDIFDSEIKHGIYPMAATNIEEKNFVFNTPGFFGFIHGYSQLPIELHFEKPAGFYGSTALIPTTATSAKDVFKVNNIDELYDSPIMYSIPDTTSLKIGNAQVLISVYSPNKIIQSKQIAEWMSELLYATKDYLGGRLPTDKYAFLYYFVDMKAVKHSFPPGLMGALEHSTSSFYYLPEVPAQQIKNSIVDISSHEFFHIITPLTIASKEVKQFNFNEAVLSKHLWLYEGVTEYTAHHVQVKYGLNSVPQFLDKLSNKITASRTSYNDTLSFTKMSKESAGKYKAEFGNVYQKGALIAAVLDIYLLHLSEGTYGLRNLTYDLGIRFGKDRYFDDEKLFEEIGKLTYPEVEDFLEKYVAGSEPIPYEYYFGLAGINFTPKVERQIISMGGIAPGLNANGVLFVSQQSKLNDFGKKLGYKIGDELHEFNGVKLTPQNLGKVIDSLKKSLKEGDPFEVKVGRQNAEGNIETVILSAPVAMIKEVDLNKLQPVQNPTKKQELVRNAWLTTKQSADAEEAPADPNDVATIDAIIKALYDVISGPPGPRNWQRFHSLYLPEAKMGAMALLPTGETKFISMTPAEYKKSNAPFFMQSGFFEEELGRKIEQYGHIANVQSAYQFRMAPGGPVAQRGVNYFTLVNSNGRWWVANLVWQDESKDNPIPQSLLKK